MPKTSELPTASSLGSNDLFIVVQSGTAKQCTLANIRSGMQTSNAALTALAALDSNGIVERTGSNTFATFAVTSTGKTLVGGANAAAMRSTLGLGTASTLNVAASGNAASGEVVKGNDSRLSDSRTPTSHTHASAEFSWLGTAALLNVASSGNASSSQVVKGDDTRLTGARAPSSHAASHGTGGSDPITPASIGAAAADHTHVFSPTHAASHAIGGIDAITPASIGAATTSHTHAEITALGTAATRDVPASGNASASQVVLGNDTRLVHGAAFTTLAFTAGAWDFSFSNASNLSPGVGGSFTTEPSGGGKIPLVASDATLASGASPVIDLDGGYNCYTLTLTTTNVTLTTSGTIKNGQSFYVVTIQGGSSGRTITWPASVTWSGGVAPSVSTDPGTVCIYEFIAHGTDLFGKLFGTY